MLMITVIKIGGNIVDDPEALDRFLDQLILVPGPKVLVHGGGKLATKLAADLGIESKMIDGRRVTDEAMLKIVTMTYAGWVNKTIVAKLQQRNANALGLTGADGNLLAAKKRSHVPVDFGFAGDPSPENVNAVFLESLLENKILPVIAPLTHDGKGQLLNTNADTIASLISSALSRREPVRLIFGFEKQGVLHDVLKPDSLLESLLETKMKELISSGKINAGMLPKIHAGFSAKRNGVNTVLIGHAGYVNEILNGTKACTRLEL
jgi:acetylglutamate kinase